MIPVVGEMVDDKWWVEDGGWRMEDEGPRLSFVLKAFVRTEGWVEAQAARPRLHVADVTWLDKLPALPRRSGAERSG